MKDLNVSSIQEQVQIHILTKLSQLSPICLLKSRPNFENISNFFPHLKAWRWVNDLYVTHKDFSWTLIYLPFRRIISNVYSFLCLREHCPSVVSWWILRMTKESENCSRIGPFSVNLRTECCLCDPLHFARDCLINLTNVICAADGDIKR